MISLQRWRLNADRAVHFAVTEDDWTKHLAATRISQRSHRAPIVQMSIPLPRFDDAVPRAFRGLILDKGSTHFIPCSSRAHRSFSSCASRTGSAAQIPTARASIHQYPISRYCTTVPFASPFPSSNAPTIGSSWLWRLRCRRSPWRSSSPTRSRARNR